MFIEAKVSSIKLQARISIYSTIAFYNNNNNCKTSIAPISLKRIELSGAPSGGVGKTHSLGKMQSSSTVIR